MVQEEALIMVVVPHLMIMEQVVGMKEVLIVAVVMIGVVVAVLVEQVV